MTQIKFYRPFLLIVSIFSLTSNIFASEKLTNFNITDVIKHHQFCTFSELDNLSQQEVALIESTFGRIDPMSQSIIRKSTTEFSETYDLITASNIKRRLIFNISTANGSKIVNTTITELVEKNGNALTTAENIRDGGIKLFLLNDGISITLSQYSKEIIFGENEVKLEGRVGFGTCFKTCVSGNMHAMSWIEGAACLLAAPECAASFTLGCTGCCVYNHNDSSNCNGL